MHSSNQNSRREKVYARVGAKTIVARADGKLLVLRRSQKCERPGGWDFPGGGSDFGENPEQTAVRETREETSLEITDIKLLTLHSYMQEDDHIVLLGFCSKWRAGEVALSWEHDQYEWISIDDALAREWPEFHRKLLEKFAIQ